MTSHLLGAATVRAGRRRGEAGTATRLGGAGMMTHRGGLQVDQLPAAAPAVGTARRLIGYSTWASPRRLPAVR